jgi:hypothetical protein
LNSPGDTQGGALGDALGGGCHCGNISVQLRLAGTPDNFRPRACDCDYCRKHGASYISDPHGTLLIRIRSAHNTVAYRQGSAAAEFLVCGTCGVLAAVLYNDNHSIHAAVNVRALDPAIRLGPQLPVSPQTLSDAEKVQRWRDIWFSSVAIDSTG